MMELLNEFLSGSVAWGVLLTLAAFALGALVNRVQFYQAEVQRCQQQYQAVHTGRNRQRQYGMTYFPQKAKREDTRKLKQIIRKKSPLSNS